MSVLVVIVNKYKLSKKKELGSTYNKNKKKNAVYNPAH